MSVISSAGSTSEGTILFMDNDIEIPNAQPANTSGGFGDLFIGIHPTRGKVALKRLRSHDESQLHVRILSLGLS